MVEPADLGAGALARPKSEGAPGSQVARVDNDVEARLRARGGETDVAEDRAQHVLERVGAADPPPQRGALPAACQCRNRGCRPRDRAGTDAFDEAASEQRPTRYPPVKAASQQLDDVLVEG